MKRVDFTKEGGFPLTQFTLEHMQSAYNDELLAAVMAWMTQRNIYGSVFGSDRIIITGVDQALGRFTEGWICIDGELLFFEGAPQNDVKTYGIGTQTITTNAEFKDFSTHGVYSHKRAVVGGDNPAEIGDYRRIPNLAALRPILSSTKTETLSALTPGASASYDVPFIGAQPGDVVVVNVVPEHVGYIGWFGAHGIVLNDNLVRVTVTNQFSIIPSSSVEVDFMIKVIK